MCSWERYCTFAREPERRKVGTDARISVQGTYYEVDANLAGEDVILWWGLFDYELFIEWDDRRFGPYLPAGGPIPLHRYRKHAKSDREKRAEKVAALAETLSIPRAAVSGEMQEPTLAKIIPLPTVAFRDPDPWGEIAHANALSARRAISEQLGKPLAELSQDDLEFIHRLVENTLNKKEIHVAIKDRFLRQTTGSPSC